MSRLLEGVFASSGSGEFLINGSVQFSKANSTSLVRRETGSSTNTRKWTWSAWVKKTKLADTQILMGSRTSDGSQYTLLFFNANDQLQFLDSQGANLVTNDVFKDTSSWYHVVCAVDTDQVTASDRVKLYINNRQITSFETASYPAQGVSTYINSTNTQLISKNGFADQVIDGYMCEINQVPVEQLDPSSFGEYNEYSEWTPKKYSGSYTNTRGYYLPMHGSFKYKEDIGKDPNVDESSSKGNDSVTNVSISTSESKYGGSSIFFQNGASYITRQRPFIDIGTEDFTVEAWIYPTTFTTESLFRRIWSVGTSLSNDFGVNIGTSGNLIFRVNDAITLTSTTALNLNQWNHVAFVRNETTIRFFINGTASGSATSFTTNLSTQGDNAFYIGNHPSGSASFNGYMNHFRITRGFARYTDTYNEDVDASEEKGFNPLDPHYHQIKLFIPGNGENGSTSIPWYKYATWDANKFVGLEEITGGHVVNNVVFAGGEYKFGSSAVRISNAQNDALWFKSGTAAGTRFMYEGDFTIESWIYFTADDGDRSIYVSHDGATYFAFNIEPSANRFNLYLNGGTPTQISATITSGQWYHVALSRSGTGTNNLKLFLNGNNIYQTTNNTTLGYKNPTIHRLGGGVSTAEWRVDNYRVYKGIGKYTTNFTPNATAIPWDNTDPNWEKVAIAVANDASQYSETVEVKYCNYNSQYTSIVNDNPTNNYAVMAQTSLFASGTIKEGGTVVNSGNDLVASFGVKSGKWYWEGGLNIATSGGNVAHFGLRASNSSGYENQYNIAGIEDDTYFYRVDNQSTWFRNGYAITAVSSSGSGATTGNGDVIRCELDLDSSPKTFKLYKNNNSSPMYTHQITYNESSPILPMIRNNSGCESWMNFGQRNFHYELPSGYKTLCSENLEQDISPKQHFDVALYTGNGLNIPNAQTISGYSLSPDIVWIKSRSSGTANQHLQDSLRGPSVYLIPNANNGDSATGTGDVSSFNSDGFTLSYRNDRTNQDGSTYAAWMWDAGSGSGVTNTNGTLQSVVKANPTAGISIITWNGNSVENTTVGHGLGTKPKFIMIKNRTTSANAWHGFCHTARRSGAEVFTSSTVHIGNKDGGVVGWSYAGGGGYNLGGGTYGLDGQTNITGNSYVGYCFAEVEGFSSIGTFYGNNSTNGPFVYTGFKPAMVIIKSLATTYNGTSVSGSWNTMDYKRLGRNDYNYVLYPNTTNAEQGYKPIDLLSNGFKLRSNNTGSGAFNVANVFLYIAFAEVPLKYSLAR